MLVTCICIQRALQKTCNDDSFTNFDDLYHRGWFVGGALQKMRLCLCVFFSAIDMRRSLECTLHTAWTLSVDNLLMHFPIVCLAESPRSQIIAMGIRLQKTDRPM